MSPVKKNRIAMPAVWVGVLVISLFLFISITKNRQKSDILFEEAASGDIVISLSTKGYLKPIDSVLIRSPISGGKITFLIPEGSYVEEEELIVQFDKTNLEKDVTEAEFAVEQQQMNETIRRQEAEKRVLQTRLKLQKARDALETVTEEVLVNKKTAYDFRLAKSNLKEARISHELAKNEYGQYEEEGSPQIRQARKKLKSAKEYLRQADVYSPSQGLVVYENVHRGVGKKGKIRLGDTVWKNMAMISLPDLSKMSVVAEVSEVDLSKIQMDQECVVKLDAFPDKSFRGKITNKGSLVKDSYFAQGVKIVEVEILIDGSHTYLRPGMTAAVDIVLKKLENVIYVPITSVFDESGEYYCYVVKGRKFIKTKVKIGDSSNNRVVILEGVDEKDKVTLFRPETHD